MTHVTANEAGRSACFIQRFEDGIHMIKAAIKQNASQDELNEMLDILTMYCRKTLKTHPTQNERG